MLRGVPRIDIKIYDCVMEFETNIRVFIDYYICCSCPVTDSHPEQILIERMLIIFVCLNIEGGLVCYSY